MTDNQIIDMTRCIHFDKSDMPNGCTCYWDGECNHDCYYKQLKRAEKRIVDLNKTIQAKEQECNKLYIQLKTDKEYYKQEENTLRKIIKNKEERNIELYTENNKLKQTLTEIKDYCNKYPQNSIGFKKYILQKISESEEQ